MWRHGATEMLSDAFRGHGHYVWQDRHDRSAYHRSYRDLSERYPDLVRQAQEDGAFGARCEEVEGKAISRDLLDSVAEIGSLRSFVNLDGAKILDIGAGYGRLGHRLVELAPATCDVRCVDGVPASTYLCGLYLDFRKATRATAVPLDEVERSLKKRPATIACNVHSFPEMPIGAIDWWLQALVAYDVRVLFLVPNEIDDLRSAERDGSRIDFAPLLASHGFSLADEALKYRASRSSFDDSVVFQDQHMLFVR
jgi:putative sugar O-methyltransferase